MTAQTPVYGLKYLTVGEAMRNTRQALQDNAQAIEAALIGTGVHPPSAADLTGLAALQATVTTNTTNIAANSTAITTLAARQVTVVKPSSTSRVSSTARLNDPHLILTGLAAGLYRVEAGIEVGAGWNLFFAVGMAAAGADPLTTVTSANATLAGVVGASAPANAVTGLNVGNASWTHATGIVRITATSSLAVTWAQSTSSATATVLNAGSYLRAERLG